MKKKMLYIVLLSFMLSTAGCRQNITDTTSDIAREETVADNQEEAAEDVSEETGENIQEETSENVQEKTEESTKYADANNWAYFSDSKDKNVDLFMVAPTADKESEYNMSISDEHSRERFVNALNTERDLFSAETNIYAPYYSQVSLKAFQLSAEEREQYLETAYADVSEAFGWYLEHENEGKPIILFGFSQGADMCYRLLQEYFSDDSLKKQLVATYAIGWPCTEQLVESYPQIIPATGETDTGVVISFDCESEAVSESLINSKDQKAYAINPLNWKTDGTVADKSLNKGACFISKTGEITKEIPELCGCYVDPERGVLKVTDVTPEEYGPGLDFLPVGSYHLNDLYFFYRNLQENIVKRIDAYLQGGA